MNKELIEDRLSEEPNVAIRVSEAEVHFYWSPQDAEPLVVTVDEGVVSLNGAFVFLHNPFWLGDLFDELPVGGILYHEGEF